jgi:hypothetical protein
VIARLHRSGVTILPIVFLATIIRSTFGVGEALVVRRLLPEIRPRRPALRRLVLLLQAIRGA